MSQRKRLWQRRDRDELKRWYKEKVSQGLIESDKTRNLRKNWSIKRHTITLRT
ncbi:MAG: hypothetical protein ABEK50_16540 [bacterium]